MAYSELIKNFEKIRAYIRDFYVYGFKSRNDFNLKSARSYDDEKRRIESWLGEYMCFTQTSEGKNVCLAVDSRATSSNPLYKAFKAKSFTDGDICLHFAIMDILYDPSISKTLNEIIAEVDELLASNLTFDDSTIRKKLKEYVDEGLIVMNKVGRKAYYSRNSELNIDELNDVLDFFSEITPLGVIGSYLKDKLKVDDELFLF